MKNKENLKKYYWKCLFLFFVLSIFFLLLNQYEYQIYTKNFNNHINSMIHLIQSKYPTITEEEIIKNLNQEETSSFFQKYGIDLNTDSILLENEKSYHTFLFINLFFFTMAIFLFFVFFIKYNRKRDKEIKSITKCIEEINHKNYELQIDTMSEDELSILKNEIYKTTIMLKEAAENALLDKRNLKQSLEDISHQLKTPLTSILIILDNLIEEPDMEEKIRNDFLRDIKRNVLNIHFFVQSLLKLSKFDANTISFQRKEQSVYKIIKEAIQNVETLCDLKNISIQVKGKKTCLLNCDFHWQVEAITNILKNCIEHSKEQSEVLMELEENNVYVRITIQDFGEGIKPKDLPYIFERFYKGESKNKESVGIGLALSKSIIEKENGHIRVVSNETGTTFIIQYAKI